MNSNYVCSNTESDFLLYDSTGNSGDDNICDNPEGWNDEGATGCTYSCGEICDLSGDYPPCGEVTLSEVVDFINLWAQGQALIADVIDLINAWVSG